MIPYVHGSLTTYGVKILVEFHTNDGWTFPRNYYNILPVLTAADNLGDYSFINYVAGVLAIHPWKLTMVCNIKKVVCNRYRLRRVTSSSRLQMDKGRCIVCRDALVTMDCVNVSNCCRARIHIMCMKFVEVCPLCGDGWTPLPCCVCKRKMMYESSDVDQMACCDVDIHKHCFLVLKQNPKLKVCPSCRFPLNALGYPYSPRCLNEYIKLRRAKRRVQRTQSEVNVDGK